MLLPLLNRLQTLTKAGAPAADEAIRAQAAAVVQALRHELPELLAVAVVDVDSGRTLAGHSSSKKLDPAKIGAYNAQVVKHNLKTLEALHLEDEAIEEVLVSMREQMDLMRLSADRKRLLYLAVSSEDTNLAVARDVLRTYAQ